MKRVILGLTLFLLVFPFFVFANQTNFQNVVKNIRANFKSALTAYESGNVKEAQLLFADSYGELFESSGMELAVGSRWPDRKTDLERQFGTLYSLAKTEDNGTELEINADRLSAELSLAATELEDEESTGGWLNQAINSLFIILREGMEAILVLAALIAYLVKTGHGDKKKIIFQAGLTAIVASLITAVIFSEVLKSAASQRENIEGITMLLASGVLFYVSYWLISKANASKWTNFIKTKADQSLSTGKLSALWFTAFLAVYREGAETTLFYQALISSAPAGTMSAIWIGLGVGAVALLLVYTLMQRTSIKLPLNIFFSATGIFLFYLCFVFAGKGVVELQVGRLIPSTPLYWLPEFSPLTFLGIYPTLESIVVQTTLLILAAFALLKLNQQRKENIKHATV